MVNNPVFKLLYKKQGIPYTTAKMHSTVLRIEILVKSSPGLKWDTLSSGFG